MSTLWLAQGELLHNLVELVVWYAHFVRTIEVAESTRIFGQMIH